LIDIVVIRSNAIIYSPRVRKIVKSLSKRYTTLVLGWNREGVSKEIIENYNGKPKLFSLRAPLGKAYLITFIPIFWVWILINLIMARPKVVHACDFDTVVPCYIYKILFRKKLVFDVCDRYAMAYISPKYKSLYSAINSLEELYAKHSDAIITVGERLLSSFQGRLKQKAVIMNCSEEVIIPEKKFFYNGKEQVNARQGGNDKGENGHIFTIVYTGNIVKSRGLERIATAIKDLHDVKLLIAGKPIDESLLHTLVRLPNVEYRGLLQPADAVALALLSDAMIILYDLQIPNNNFSMSNKLFEAMMCGLPIITNVSTEIVREEVGCGTIVDYNDADKIKAAVISLRDDPLLCRKLGNNGRKAFLQKYNWGIMEKKLLEIYENLL
jgi:glycosyltransferase involved in cell wall biosynthesis